MSTQPLRTIAWLMASLAATLASSPGGLAAAQPVATIIDTGCKSDRAIAVDLFIEGDQAVTHATCVSDRGGQPARRTARSRLSLSETHRVLRSIYSTDVSNQYNVSVTREPSAQSVNIERKNGSSCAEITAKSQVRRPLPLRFLDKTRDWQASTDYLIDDDCTYVAVRAGNFVALSPIIQTVRFMIYELRVEVQP